MRPITERASLILGTAAASETILQSSTEIQGSVATDQTHAVAQRTLSMLKSILEIGILPGATLHKQGADWTSSADLEPNCEVAVVHITSITDLNILKRQASCNPFSIGMERKTDCNLITTIEPFELDELKKGSSLIKIRSLLEDHQSFKNMLQYRAQRTALFILHPSLHTQVFAEPEHRTGPVPLKYIEKILISSDLMDELKSSDLGLLEKVNGTFFIKEIQIVPISSRRQPLIYPLRRDGDFLGRRIDLYAPDFFSLLEGYLTSRQVGNLLIEPRYNSERPLIIHTARLCDMTTLEEGAHLIDLAPEVRTPQIEIGRLREESVITEQLDETQMLAMWHGPESLLQQVDLAEGGGGLEDISHFRHAVDHQRSLAPRRNLLTLARNKVTGIFARLKNRAKGTDKDSLL